MTDNVPRQFAVSFEYHQGFGKKVMEAFYRNEFGSIGCRFVKIFKSKTSSGRWWVVFETDLSADDLHTKTWAIFSKHTYENPTHRLSLKRYSDDSFIPNWCRLEREKNNAGTYEPSADLMSIAYPGEDFERYLILRSDPGEMVETLNNLGVVVTVENEAERGTRYNVAPISEKNAAILKLNFFER